MATRDLNLTVINARLSQESEALMLHEIESAFTQYQRNPPTTLYHYTTLDAFISIIETRILRLSHINYLNDSSEYQYGLGLVNEAIEQKIKTTSELDPSSLLSGLQIAISAYANANVDYYVTSFSEVGNALSQWRAYCQNGGVSLGFSARKLLKNESSNLQDVQLMKVLYNSDDQISLINRVIDILITTMEDKNLSFENKGSNLLEVFVRITAMIIPWLKHPSFQEEKEWRLIKRHYFPSDILHSPKKFRSTGRLIVPFVEAGFEANLPLREVNCGPSLFPELNMKSIKAVLDKYGYSIEPVGVDTPLRIVR